MKKVQWIFSLLLGLFFLNTAQAQILEKMKKAMEAQAANKTAAKSTDGETAKTTDNGLGSESMASALGYGKNKVDASVVPNSYPFSWKYKMEIQSEKGKAMVAEYFLEPNAEYIGFNMGQSNDMFMIMDYKNKLTITCFNQGKEKMASASKTPDYSEMAKKETGNSKFNYKALPNKTFLGFNCKGMEATNEEYNMVFYYTNDAGVSFGDVFKSQQNQKMPNAFKDYFKPGDKPLMLFMTMKDLKNKGTTTTMKCIALEKKSYVFNKSDYKFM